MVMASCVFDQSAVWSIVMRSRLLRSFSGSDEAKQAQGHDQKLESLVCVIRSIMGFSMLAHRIKKERL